MFLIPHIEARSTRRKGRGVFATDIIRGGVIIGDYLGIVLPTNGSAPKCADDEVYDMWYSGVADIRPNPNEEGVHLLNASCEPNCAMASLSRHTLIFALRRIFPDEELTFDYFLGEQEKDCKPGTDNCHCGSPFCRGTLYSNPQAYAAWEEFLGEQIGNVPEEPPVPYGERLPPLPEYPETIDDHPIYPLFGCRTEAPHPCRTAMPSVPDMRVCIRETGRRLLLPEWNMIVEGILYGGHAVMEPCAKRSASPAGCTGPSRINGSC